MTGPVVRAEGLSRWYGEVIGLNDVSIEIEPGITGLLGPNGAGKSSFLRVVAGELKPSMGSVRVLGERPFANARLHSRIGYSPEGDRFFGELTCREFLVHLLRLSGFRGRDARRLAADALTGVGMAASAGTRLSACSRGMRQRVKLAQALAHDPEFLLLDEPLAGLDPIGRHEFQQLLIQKAEKGLSVIVSSHVLHEIESLTNRILLIHKGRIAASGEVSELRSLMDRHPHRIRIETPRSRRLAGFLVDRADVRSLHFEADAITVETTDPERLYGALPGLIVSEDLDVKAITSPDDRLEAIFDIVVNRGGLA